MAQTAHEARVRHQSATKVERRGAYWAYQLLHIGFVVAPIMAGLDKFVHWMTTWEVYLAPVFPQMLNVTPEAFMRGVGVIEIIAGLVVLFKPRIGGYLVAAWLAGIIFNLVIHPMNWSADPSVRMWDIALRDFGLMLGALALAWLSTDLHVQETERQ